MHKHEVRQQENSITYEENAMISRNTTHLNEFKLGNKVRGHN